eukprot:3500852-Rhodomonas_salina.4
MPLPGAWKAHIARRIVRELRGGSIPYGATLLLRECYAKSGTDDVCYAAPGGRKEGGRRVLSARRLWEGEREGGARKVYRLCYAPTKL